MMLKKKPSMKELLVIITTLQGHVGKALACHANDRDPNGYEKGQDELEKALELCINARSFDPPTDN